MKTSTGADITFGDLLNWNWSEDLFAARSDPLGDERRSWSTRPHIHRRNGSDNAGWCHQGRKQHLRG